VAGLTDKAIAKAVSEAKKTGSDIFRTDGAKARGIGSLRLRARPTGQCLLYFRYGNPAGKQDSIPVGVYDITGKTGLTLRKARAKAGELSQLYQAGRKDLRGYLEHQEAQARVSRESAARDRAEAKRQSTAGTFQALFDGYVVQLEQQGRSSAADARNLFRRNVCDPDASPHLAAMPARQITSEDISGILGRVIQRGKGRTAAKLRSYLRAAFAAALAAPYEPTIHPALHGFHLIGNPAAAVPAKGLAQFNVAGERTLNATELQAFLKAVDALSAGLSRDVLWLSLLLGGQRFAQLVRARPQDVDMDELTITLFDPKGARKQPRAHRLPLTERAVMIVKRWLDRALVEQDDGSTMPYVFTNNGKVPIRGETLSGVVSEICAAMLKAKTARAPFTLRDIRRTCETMLAALGVSKDLRAQLQSHGLGGVQDRHYDRHEYMEEKRRALEAWDARLIEIAGGGHGKNVVPLRKKA
jgi:integrase